MMTKSTLTLLTTTSLLGAVLGGCVPEPQIEEDCAVGAAHCECVDDQFCDGDLVCMGGVCLSPQTDDDSSTGEAGEDESTGGAATWPSATAETGADDEGASTTGCDDESTGDDGPVDPTDRPMDGSLIVHYDFDGGSVEDRTGHGHDGIVHGAPQSVEGQSDGAIYVDNQGGNLDYVQLPNLGVVATDYTVAIRFSTTDTSGAGGRLLGNSPLVMNYAAGSHDSVEVSGGGGGYQSFNPDGQVSDGQWYWYIFSVAADGDATIYVDDTVIASWPTTGEAPPFDNFSLGVNAEIPGYGARLTTIDDFRLYGAALSVEEVTDLVEEFDAG